MFVPNNISKQCEEVEKIGPHCSLIRNKSYKLKELLIEEYVDQPYYHVIPALITV